jgi:amino acid adenylation domain-containing protein
LDKKCLREAINEVVCRHEILRTSFADSTQIVHNCEPLVADEICLQDVGACGQERVAALWTNSLQQPLHPIESLRVTVIAFSPLKHSILLSLFAMCADLPSLENLAREIGEIYAARQRGESLPSKTMQYGDLANWQNELLQAPELQIGRDYWSKLDAESATVQSLPFRTEASPQAGLVLQEFTSYVPSALVLRIRQAIAKRGGSLSTFILACWALLLARSSNAAEIVLGVACDGRKYEELKNVIGPLTRFLPIVVSCAENISFASLLAALEQAVAANYKWQECFSWHKGIPAFGFEYARECEPSAAEDLTFRLEKAYACIDRFSISLFCHERDGSLMMHIQYDTHDFQPEEISLLAERLHQVLESAIDRLEAPVLDLHVLGPLERRKVLVDFNSTMRRPLSALCIPELFEQQVQRTPNSFAIITSEGQLTYQDLNRRANQLARYLARRGIGVESRVAILMERSLDMFVGVMAILKAGAAYVPLNAQHPAERIAYVLTDAAPGVLLTQRHLAASLHASCAKTKTICIDEGEHSERIAKETDADLSIFLSPESLAYLIYTSGSTGTPKGIMVSHRALVNHALQMIDFYGLAPDRRMLQFFPLSFDASAEDIFPALLSGAVLVPPRDLLAYAPSELLEFCRRFEITTLHLPVALWHRLVDEVSTRGLSLPHHIRMLSVGGESPGLSKLAAWNQLTAGQVAFRNMYGPTEATITASVYQQDGPLPSFENRSRVPIGRPLANVSIYLLDDAMEPVPVGVQGEIYIGGMALARGYVNQPGLTAEKFLPDPFSEHAGARLYRTGDLAQFSVSGEIDFLGRIDHQVKIRGFRVELGEIERILLEHSAIKDSVVAVHQNGTGDKRLAAYITLKLGHSVTARQMRNHLRDRLPEYMFPSWFVVLNSLPLTSTGKVNRKALPAPTNENLSPEQEYVAPRSPTEEIVTAIFAELLQAERIGIMDNFFECGGHSLLAIQLASRLRETFQAEVSLRRIFDDPTAAGVAAALLEEADERLRVERTAELMVKLASVSDDQAETMLEKPLGR